MRMDRAKGAFQVWDAQGASADETAVLRRAGAGHTAVHAPPRGPVRALPSDVALCVREIHSDFSAYHRLAFIMMRFGDTARHRHIAAAIREALAPFGIAAARADDKQYHDELFGNVLAYLHACDFGIAVFERMPEGAYSPNVALEVGYMMALGKPLCLLKDQTVGTLPTDLVGRLYGKYDPKDPGSTIPPVLAHWMVDKHLVPGT